MIELTEQQIRALQASEASTQRLVNPHTREQFVLIRLEDYERLTADEYDDSPWTPSELHTLAWEAGKTLGWEDMDEYDTPEAP